MIRYGFVCLLLASISWGQVATSKSVSETQGNESVQASAHGSTSESNEPVITIAGLCNDSGSQVISPKCKTVVTQAQFEKVVNAVQPGMTKRGRKEFAERYADALVLAKKAEELGLD